MQDRSLPVVFGVGLNKTGTTSLGRACEILGYRAFHHETRLLRDASINRRVDRAVDEGAHPFAHARRLLRYNSFFDMRAVERHFDAFDRAYPQAKFILHTRDLNRWLDSREKHVRRNIDAGIGTWTTIDREEWAREFHEHHERVHTYFRGRPQDILEIDLTQDARWEPLCEFLRVPVPGETFPNENTAAGAERSGLRYHVKRMMRATGILR